MTPNERAHPRDRATIWSKEWRLQNLFRIKTERATLAPMRFRPTQRALFERMRARGFRGVRDMVLKSRKPGVTTFYEVAYLDDSLFFRNRNTLIQAHRKDDLEKLFEIVRLAYRTCPDTVRLRDGRLWTKPRARYDNANELAFEGMNSSIRVALSNLGGTNHNLHISEAASIEDVMERLLPTMETVPNRAYGSNITVESTARGMGGWFHETWTEAEAGLSEFELVFFAWWTSPKNAVEPPRDFRPTQEEEAMVAKVAERYGTLLTPAQVFWWRTKKQRLKKLMDQEHPTFPEDAFLTSDSMVFDADVLRAIVPAPPRRIWKKVEIWREPVPGRRYVLGADPAEGVGGDYSTIEVVDAVTLEQVAEYASNTIPPGKFAKTIARVGAYYNNALAAVERNNHGHLVLDRLRDDYGNIFMKVVTDERTAKKTKKLGWETTSHTRDLMLDELTDLLGDGEVRVKSGKLKNEMLTFVTNEDGKREAKEGCHDDRIMALAIAVKVARMPQPSFGVYRL